MESYDNGNNWQIVMDTFQVHDISINPENNQNMWGVVYTGYMDWLLFFSNDGGQNWNLYEGFEDQYLWVTSLYADKDFNLYIVRETGEPRGIEIKKSTDNGISWFTLDNFPGGIFENRLEADYTNTDNIYFGTYYGIYHSDDGGITTQLENTGLMNSYIKDLEVHPFNSDIVYAGGKQGLWKSTDGCYNWQQIVDKSINATAFDPVYPDTLYYGGSGLKRSYNGGLTFEDIKHNIKSGISNISINPKNTNIIYVSSGVDDFVFFVYKSTNYGDSWMNVFTSNYYERYTKIIIDPFYPDTLYFGTHRSLDGGITWENNALEIRIVAIHPDNSDILYASDGNNLKVSYDWGNNFQLITEYLNGPFPGQNIRSFTIAKNDPDYLFYCTLNDGIHYSTDAGENWQKLEGSYENRTLDIIPLINENKYYIATHGDGVWVYDTTYVNTINDNLFIKDNNYLQVFPNPSSKWVNISFPCNETGILSIYKLNGEKLFETNVHNKKELEINLANMNKGLHLLVFKNEDNKI